MAFFSIASPDEACIGDSYRVLVIGSETKLVVATETECGTAPSVTELHVPDDPSNIVCAAVSSSRLQVAACTDNKTLAVWRRDKEQVGWTWHGKRVLPKRATVIRFIGRSLVVGDKTGEAHRYTLDGPDWTASSGGHLLGHFSMLLDMVLSPSNSHVITCDRDEKIRVSKFPNSYNIESFCLGHTEFVSSICFCPKWPHLLISGSGDGTVKVWEWLSGRLLGSEQVGEVQEGGGVPRAVTKVSCSSMDSPIVVATVEKSSQLVAFTLSANGSLLPWGCLQLTTTPWDITFDWANTLWVCLDSQPRPVRCYRWLMKESGLELVTDCSSLLLESLNKWEYFAELHTTKDWDQMRKNHVDNMDAYLTRKEERLNAKKSKLAETTAADSSSQESSTHTEIPPHKKSKVETTVL